MFQKQALLLNRIHVFFDLVTTALVFIFTYHLRANFIYLAELEVGKFKEYAWLLLVILPTWWLLLKIFGVYRSQRTASLGAILVLTVKTSIYGVLTVIAFLFVFKVQMVSRLMVLIFGFMAALFLSIEKIAALFILRFMRCRGYNFRHALIVGSGSETIRAIDTLHNNPEWGFKIIGIVSNDHVGVASEIGGIKVLGSFRDVPKIIEAYIVDEVICAVPFNSLAGLKDILYICEQSGVTVRIAVELFETIIAKTYLEDFGGIPVLTFRSTPFKVEELFIKHTFDRIASLALLIILSPLFLIISILIKLTSKGPVLFRQKRVGFYGREFTLYKFRSMVYNAEELREKYEHLNKARGPVFKICDDPRITKVGKFLRRTSLDELPQIVNVLSGRMSLVGPRPPIPQEVAKYSRSDRRRLSMKPGITGLWQVSGRSDIAFEDWMKLDLKYIDSWSLKEDFSILIKTLPALFTGKGAY